MRALTRVFALTVSLTLVACGDDRAMPLAESGPEAGTLAVTLSSIGEDDGAISFELTGPGIDGVRGAEGVAVFTTPVSGGVRVAALADGLEGVVVRFDVPDVARAEEYRATVLEVADTDDLPRPDVGGYGLEIVTR